jgi:hypothetical protein
MKAHLWEGTIHVGQKLTTVCGKRKRVKSVVKPGSDFIMCGRCWSGIQNQPIRVNRPVKVNVDDSGWRLFRGPGEKVTHTHDDHCPWCAGPCGFNPDQPEQEQ